MLKKLFTAAQVEKLRARLHKENMVERMRYGAERYEQGVRAGEKAVREALIEALGLDDRFIDRHN